MPAPNKVGAGASSHNQFPGTWGTTMIGAVPSPVVLGNTAGTATGGTAGTGPIGAGVAHPPATGPHVPPFNPVQTLPTQGKIAAVGSHFHAAL